MNKKILYKGISILIIAMIALLFASTISMANSSFLTPPSPQESSLIEPAQNIAGTILAIVQVIGASVAIIMLIVLAIKYMSAAPNDKAEIKKHAVVYVVGAVVLFAASGLLGIIRGFASNLGSGGSGNAGGGGNNAQSDGGLVAPGGQSMSFD